MASTPMIGSLVLQATTLVFGAALVFAAVNDILYFRIPNWLSLSVAALFVLFGFLAQFGATEFALRIALGVGVLGVGFGLFSAGLLGGGDVKLLAAISPWMGWPGLINYFAIVAVFGGLLALFLLLARRISIPLPNWLMERRWLVQHLDEKTGIPYGVAISAGGLVMISGLNGSLAG